MPKSKQMLPLREHYLVLSSQNLRLPCCVQNVAARWSPTCQGATLRALYNGSSHMAAGIPSLNACELSNIEIFTRPQCCIEITKKTWCWSWRIDEAGLIQRLCSTVMQYILRSTGGSIVVERRAVLLSKRDAFAHERCVMISLLR